MITPKLIADDRLPPSLLSLIPKGMMWISAKELRRVLHLSPSSLSQKIKRLKGKGVIRTEVRDNHHYYQQVEI